MIEFDNRILGIENLKNLLFVSLGIPGDFLASKLFARLRLTGRIADHAGEIADQKDNLMPQVLKLLHLLNQHGMTEMKIRRGGIKSSFDPERPALFELGNQLFFGKNLHRAPFDCFKLCLEAGHFNAWVPSEFSAGESREPCRSRHRYRQ